LVWNIALRLGRENGANREKTTTRAETKARLLMPYLSGLSQLRSRFQRLRERQAALLPKPGAAKTATVAVPFGDEEEDYDDDIALMA
jgi:hypothetical protein